jgi:hypothetical protein
VDKETLLKKAREAAKGERQRAENVCKEFERKKGRRPSLSDKKQIRGYVARMVSVVADMKTDSVFAATSGRPPSKENFHVLLRERMPDPGLEPKNNLEAARRPPQACAEVQAADKALKSRADAQISDLMIATVQSGNGRPQVRCENCKVTLSGATVITDEMAEEEVANV